MNSAIQTHGNEDGEALAETIELDIQWKDTGRYSGIWNDKPC